MDEAERGSSQRQEDLVESWQELDTESLREAKAGDGVRGYGCWMLRKKGKGILQWSSLLTSTDDGVTISLEL